MVDIVNISDIDDIVDIIFKTFQAIWFWTNMINDILPLQFANAPGFWGFAQWIWEM